MIEHSVRWKSATRLVKVGKYWIPKVGITGDYRIKGGKLKGKNNDGEDTTRDGTNSDG